MSSVGPTTSQPRRLSQLVTEENSHLLRRIRECDLDSRLDSLVSSLQGVISTLLTAVVAFDPARESEFSEALGSARSLAESSLDRFVAPEQLVLSEAVKAREKQAHRRNTLQELVVTEQDYLRDLQVIQDVWAVEVGKSGVFAQQEMQIVFGSIEQLVLLSKELVSGLSRDAALPVQDQRVGATFKMMVPFMKVYIDYCSSQVQAGEILQNPKYKDRLFALSNKVAAQHPEVKNLDLGSFLIKPTQRLMKFPLFLKDLASDTAPEHPDRPALLKCLADLHSVIQEINARTRERETLVFLSQKMLPAISWRSPATAIDLMASKCRLVIEGKISALVSRKPATESPSSIPEKGGHVVLFDNLLVVCRVVKDQWQELVSLPTSGLAVKDTAQSQSVTLEHHQNPEEITLSFVNKVETKVWVDGLVSAIATASTASPLKYVASHGKAAQGKNRSPVSVSVSVPEPKAEASKTPKAAAAGAVDSIPPPPVADIGPPAAPPPALAAAPQVQNASPPSVQLVEDLDAPAGSSPSPVREDLMRSHTPERAPSSGASPAQKRRSSPTPSPSEKRRGVLLSDSCSPRDEAPVARLTSPTAPGEQHHAAGERTSGSLVAASPRQPVRKNSDATRPRTASGSLLSRPPPMSTPPARTLNQLQRAAHSKVGSVPMAPISETGDISSLVARQSSSHFPSSATSTTVLQLETTCSRQPSAPEACPPTSSSSSDVLSLGDLSAMVSTQGSHR